MKVKVYAIVREYNNNTFYYAFWDGGTMWVTAFQFKDIHFFTKKNLAVEKLKTMDERDKDCYRNITVKTILLEMD